MCIYINTYVYICMYIFRDTPTYIYIHIYVYMYMYMWTHVLECIYIYSCPFVFYYSYFSLSACMPHVIVPRPIPKNTPTNNEHHDRIRGYLWHDDAHPEMRHDLFLNTTGHWFTWHDPWTHYHTLFVMILQLRMCIHHPEMRHDPLPQHHSTFIYVTWRMDTLPHPIYTYVYIHTPFSRMHCCAIGPCLRKPKNKFLDNQRIPSFDSRNAWLIVVAWHVLRMSWFITK